MEPPFRLRSDSEIRNITISISGEFGNQQEIGRHIECSRRFGFAGLPPDRAAATETNMTAPRPNVRRACDGFANRLGAISAGDEPLFALTGRP
jgi:hypothetical protein